MRLRLRDALHTAAIQYKDSAAETEVTPEDGTGWWTQTRTMASVSRQRENGTFSALQACGSAFPTVQLRAEAKLPTPSEPS